jgi:hypothetical protein
VLAEYLGDEMPDDENLDEYAIVPHYTEDTAEARRIVCSCPSGERVTPQLSRWRTRAAVHIITPAEFAQTHAEVVAEVETLLRAASADGLISDNVSVDGMIESSHQVDTQNNRITDSLGLDLIVRQI